MNVYQRWKKSLITLPFYKFRKPMLGRKELFESTLTKVAYASKLINDLHLLEEETKWLRHYIDESNYTDLEWWQAATYLVSKRSHSQRGLVARLSADMVYLVGCDLGSQDGNITTCKCRPSGFKRRLNRKHGSVVLAFVVDECFALYKTDVSALKRVDIGISVADTTDAESVVRRFLYDDSLLSDLLWLLASLAGLAVNWFNMVANGIVD
ncbi:peroxisomal acyl-coenzyme A oxidase 1-like protein [Tanacetum coccineum]